MSLVGPRPSTAYEYEMFQPRHRRRCETLPGLTGLWQVNGKNRTTFEKMMELDLPTLRTKSLFLDVKIIASTLPAILLQVWDVHTGRKAAAKAQPAEVAARVLPQSSAHANGSKDAESRTWREARLWAWRIAPDCGRTRADGWLTPAQ